MSSERNANDISEALSATRSVALFNASRGLRRLAFGLVAVAAVLIALSLLTRFLAWRRELATPGIEPPWWMEFFDVNSVANLPTWFNVGLLLTAGAAAAFLAWLFRASNTRVAGFLALMAVGMLAASLDELASIHEQLNELGSTIGGSALHFSWVVPGAIVALIGVLILARGLSALHVRDRWPFIWGVVIFLTGALVVETIGGMVLEAHGDRGAYLLVTAAEEFLEMAGATLLLIAVVRLVSVEREGTAVRLVPQLYQRLT